MIRSGDNRAGFREIMVIDQFPLAVELEEGPSDEVDNTIDNTPNTKDTLGR